MLPTEFHIELVSEILAYALALSTRNARPVRRQLSSSRLIAPRPWIQRAWYMALWVMRMD